ncbi:helix-turn-helix domain-containing protein [Sphingobacterium sp. SGG-5]|uniref:helix-turn-helix domain-containing protein n=1 Tax=Sphingobacterium sp. SGG-5 TaxID=2710881 RepID=UPI0013ED1718|nr:helix-turn-helix domain-containing protein [Sphingobacterium sp. SGG-5]NGM63551.1 helix-turn-helix domain-containing protein [Sphingobacterium sp. SGG-5]
MLQVTINEDQLNSIIDAAVNRAVAKERESNEETSLMDGEQICKRFGVTKQTLQKWRDRKEIPFVQIGTVIRYDFNKIIKYKEIKRRR